MARREEENFLALEMGRARAKALSQEGEEGRETNKSKRPLWDLWVRLRISSMISKNEKPWDNSSKRVARSG